MSIRRPSEDAVAVAQPAQASAAPDAAERETPVREPRVAAYDVVDDTGAASFPASDPPSWWGGG